MSARTPSEWRWDAEQYARSSAAQTGWAMELIERLSLRSTESVLDIGCGDGRVTFELSRRVREGNVLGIDSSEDMIRRALAAFPPERHANLSFRLMDARSISFEPLFDVAFSNATLHWVKDRLGVYRGVARALRPGGRLLFQMGGRGNGAQVFAVARELVEEAKWREFFRGFEFPWGFHGPEEEADWCVQAGLRVRRAELLQRDMEQEGVVGLAAWIRTTWMPYTQRVPVELREPFILEAAARYVAAHPADHDGRVWVRMVRLEVEAEKS
jgi:trans-aconitate 2-methyltransferase